ncbi:MAG: Flp pilus assembly protein CpaB [Candidatus Omnitrophota bacterium]
MQKQRILFIVGIVLAFLVALLVKVALDQQRQAAREEYDSKIKQIKQAEQGQQEELLPVLFAKKDIPRGAVIDPNNLEKKGVPQQFIEPQAVSSYDRIAGMVTVITIPKDAQITLTKLMYPKQAGGLADVTPFGKRAVTISVENSAALLAGMIRPRNCVDVIGIIPVPMQTADGKQVNQLALIPLFQNVLVLAVGQETSTEPAAESRAKKEETRESSPLITLALSPQEANLISFVQEQGKIRLVMRSPTDAQPSAVQTITAGNLATFFQAVLPPDITGIEPPPSPNEDFVEIYRGLNREKVSLSKPK